MLPRPDALAGPGSGHVRRFSPPRVTRFLSHHRDEMGSAQSSIVTGPLCVHLGGSLRRRRRPGRRTGGGRVRTRRVRRDRASSVSDAAPEPKPVERHRGRPAQVGSRSVAPRPSRSARRGGSMPAIQHRWSATWARRRAGPVPRDAANSSGADPRAVMIENVRGITGRKFDDYRAELIKEFKELGFECCGWEVLDAADFGVPQNRLRAVLVVMKPNAASTFAGPIRGREAHSWQGASTPDGF